MSLFPKLLLGNLLQNPYRFPFSSLEKRTRFLSFVFSLSALYRRAVNSSVTNYKTSISASSSTRSHHTSVQQTKRTDDLGTVRMETPFSHPLSTQGEGLWKDGGHPDFQREQRCVCGLITECTLKWLQCYSSVSNLFPCTRLKTKPTKNPQHLQWFQTSSSSKEGFQWQQQCLS